MDIKKSKPPSWRVLFSHPAHLVACGFGSGLSPFAPGTVGTLFAWATFYLFRPWLGDLALLAVFIACFVIGVAAVHKTGADLGVVDHGSIVWDEIVPFWLVLLFCPAGWLWQTAACLLFRFFGLVKPQPARFLGTRVKNGFGVMTDDLFAGVYTVLVLQGALFLLS